MTVRAARLAGDGEVSIARVAAPEPAAGEVVVRVHANALCGSDRHGYRHGSAVTPGHEIAGVVEAVGQGVAGIAAGDRGAIYLVEFCGDCAACRAGSTNMCLRRAGMIGFTVDGGLADLVRIPQRCFLPVPASVGLAEATALLDLFGTTLHALRRAERDVAGAAVAVMGCGPIGAGAVAVARALGAAEVHAVDVVGYRLELAEQLGAVVHHGGADPAAAIRRRVPDGCAIVVEAAGLPATQRAAIDVAGPDGRVIVVAHGPEPIALRLSAELVGLERALIGSEYFPIGRFGEALDLVASGRLDPAPLITHRFALDDADAAFRAFFSGETGKVLVLP